MGNENAEHEKKRNNGADKPFPVGEEHSRHIAGTGLALPCAKRGQKENGAVLKAAGLKSGVPDICLPVPSNGFHGLYIELKFGANKATEKQEDFMDGLRQQDIKRRYVMGQRKQGRKY